MTDLCSLVDIATSAFFYGLDEFFIQARPSEHDGQQTTSSDWHQLVDSDDDSLATKERSYTGEWERTGGAVTEQLNQLNNDDAIEVRLKGKLRPKIADKPWLPTQKSVLDRDLERVVGVAPLMSKSARKKASKRNRPDDAGAKWFNLPAQELTPELATELQMLAMRQFAYKDRFYKKTAQEPPKHFHVGVVEASRAEFYRSKTRKDRNKSFVDQFMEDTQASEWVSKKYQEHINSQTMSQTRSQQKRQKRR